MLGESEMKYVVAAWSAIAIYAAIILLISFAWGREINRLRAENKRLRALLEVPDQEHLPPRLDLTATELPIGNLTNPPSPSAAGDG